MHKQPFRYTIKMKLPSRRREEHDCPLCPLCRLTKIKVDTMLMWCPLFLLFLCALISCTFVDIDASSEYCISDQPEKGGDGTLDADDSHVVAHTGA